MGMGMDMDYYHLAYFVGVLVIVLRESLQFTYVVKSATSQHSMREGSGEVFHKNKKTSLFFFFFCGLQARAPATKKKSWGRTRDSFYCWEGLEPGAQQKNWGRGSRISFCGRPLSFLKKKVRRSLIYYICIWCIGSPHKFYALFNRKGLVTPNDAKGDESQSATTCAAKLTKWDCETWSCSWLYQPTYFRLCGERGDIWLTC